MMSIPVQFGLAILLLAIGVTKGSWYLKWPAIICGLLLLLRPLDELLHWVMKFLPAFLVS